MNFECRTECLPNYETLLPSQMRKLHNATLSILRKVGVDVLHKGAVELLKEAGCTIENGKRGKLERVKIPEWLVEDCINSAPSRITIFDRCGEPAMFLEGKQTNFGMGTDLPKTRDLETDELRPTTLKDVREVATVADALPNIDFIGSNGLPSDVETNTMYIESFKAQIECSKKPIFFTAANEKDLGYILEMAEAITGGKKELAARPFLIHYSEPTSPLTHSDGAVAKLMLCAERGVPVNYTPAVLSGASGPATIAGGIVQGNAEALSGLVIHQLTRKGSPIITGTSVLPIDMRSTCISYTAPQHKFAYTVIAAMYHYYNLPVWGTAGVSDSHILDEQTAFEHALTIYSAALEGSNLVHDIGFMGQGLVSSSAALVMCDEIISYVRTMLKGFEINDVTLALDIIEKVGPGGNYIGERHTYENFKRDMWEPKLANRLNPDNWVTAGSKTYKEKAVEKAIKILKEHNTIPLTTEVQEKIDKTCKRASESLKNEYLSA
jgi:trimethylamine--corrinoid protein Co-methyltransferase